jgi:putative endonuclease
MKFYYTYVLKSENDKKYYIGWTDNLISRFIKHNKGKVTTTRTRVPLKLVYYEACLNKNKAVIREKQLKTGFGRAYLKRRLN